MSDFLTRLAQLTRGEAAVVSPRLPGRYAPLPETGPGDFAGTGVQQQSGSASAREPAHSPLSRGLEVKKLSPGKVDEGSQGRRSGIEAGSQDSGMPQSPMLPDEPGRSMVDAPLMPASVVPAELSSTGSGEGAVDGRAGAQNEAGSGQSTASGANDSPQNPITTELNTPPGRATQQGGLADNSPAQQSRPLVRGHQGRQPEPQRQMTELPAVSDQAAKQEPSVHIHIGRVEVRAQTAAPVPAPLSARPGPQSSLSLQDYLKRGRSQDGRS